ncbi:MAG TPA: hypothetical protein VGZ52_01140 [Acidimicrobiales bacterium]|nr:hypothetical protein [Acidimicrobiales bacterium]
MRKLLSAVGVAFVLVALPARPSAAATPEVHIANGAPQPAQLAVVDGDTVTFVNDDDVAHAIFSQGAQRGATVAPHTASAPYGPFRTGGSRGEFAYQVDNGASGTIIVNDTQTTTAPPPPSPTVAAPTTTASAPTTKPASSGPSSVVDQVSTKDNKNQSRLAVLGLMLLVAGLVGLILVSSRSRRSRDPERR